MKIPTHEELIKDIEGYITKNNMTGRQFGQDYLKDSGAISRLRNGLDPRLSTVQKIYKVIDGDMV